VRARVANPLGHTRLPAYARGRGGVVESVQGEFALPDDVVAGTPEPRRESVYNVRFASGELWGPDEGERFELSLDLWESYLEPDGGRT
jgi:nitrile hydratase